MFWIVFSNKEDKNIHMVALWLYTMLETCVPFTVCMEENRWKLSEGKTH